MQKSTTSWQVDLDTHGNQGLVAIHKVKLHYKSVMLYHFVANLLKTTKMPGYCMNQEEYTYGQAGDHSIQPFCELIVWAMGCKEIWPHTKVSTNNLETNLSKFTFAGCNTSILVLIIEMLDFTHQIEAKRGIIYKSIASSSCSSKHDWV